MRHLLPLLTATLLACQPADTTPDRPAQNTPASTPPASTPPANTSSIAPDPSTPRNLYWGDTHLHTSDSPDAFFFGTRLSPEDALRFARGDAVTATGGLEARLSRPLDFLVIADHAVGLGLMREVLDGNPALVSDPVVAQWSEDLRAGGEQAAATIRTIVRGHSAGTNPVAVSDPARTTPILRDVWTRRGMLLDAYNDPGTFTAFVGYEWTPAPNGDNLHRVLVFRDGAALTNTILPFSSTLSDDPEDLWAWLGNYETSLGGEVFAIPHNSNLSGGLMFALQDREGDPIDTAYARTRATWEPLVEVTQVKGDSETTAHLSPDDAFAAFGDAGWEATNLIGAPRGPDTHAGSYAREALKRGLLLEQRTGTNPFKFGMIGSTDSHTGLATADSDNFFGKFTTEEPGPARATLREALAPTDSERFAWQYLASGLAAVWAEANTREAIFDAMERKEVYATTGPRMRVRMFAGPALSEADLGDAEAGYAKGVPMGGDLSASPTAPTLLVTAQKDPEGANLDRIQIVKGELRGGTLRESVFDVAWSGGRQPSGGELPPVGDTVEGATYSNAIGAAELSTAWTDPDFDPASAAFYYARVLEIPTPHWTRYDAARYGAQVPAEAPASIQERAYTSPIWYTP